MDFGNNPPSRYVSKLNSVKEGVNSQILDYYKRFGQNRDLEQYFLSHETPEIRSGTSSSIYSDGSQFVTARCLNANNDHTQCQKKAQAIKEQTSKSLSFENYQSPSTFFKNFNLERSAEKKQINVKYPLSYKMQENIPDVEINMEPQSPNKATNETSDRSDKSNNKYVALSGGDDEILMDNSAAKVVSPGSSITRKLEWDSMADVGYAYAEQGGFSEQNLSTLEKIALRRRYDPKEETDNPKADSPKTLDTEMQNVVKMGIPNAHSTPEMEDINTKKKIPITTKSSRERINRKTTSKHFKNTGSYEINYKDCEKASKVTIDMSKKFTFETPRSNIDANKNEDDKPNIDPTRAGKSRSSPKAQDQVLKNPNEDRIALRKVGELEPESATSNKEIQTSSRISVSTSAQTLKNIEDESQSLTNILSKTPIILNVLKNPGKLKTYSVKPRRKKITPLKMQHALYASPDKETLHSYDSNDDEKSALPEIFGADNSAKCSILTVAESFEYMPGHLFEHKKTSPPEQSQETSSLPGSSQCVTTPTSFPGGTSSSTISSNTADILKIFERSSQFSKDLNTSIDAISKLINTKHKDPEVKKRLIKKIVKILVKQDYPDDDVCETIITPDSDNLTQATNSNDQNSTSDNVTNLCSLEKDEASIQGTEINIIDKEIKDNIIDKEIIPDPTETLKEKTNAPTVSLLLPISFPRKGRIDRCLTADSFMIEKLKNPNNPTRSVKSAPVTLSYTDYLKQKADSIQSTSSSKSQSNVSEGHSKNSDNPQSASDSKETKKTTISSSAKSGSTFTIDLPSSKASIVDLKTTNKKTQTKSELIYEQYLLAKLNEEEKQRQLLQKKQRHDKKKQELQLKEEIAKSISQIKKAYAASSVSSANTQTQLAAINDEILQLTVLKLKLENKHNPKNLELLKSYRHFSLPSIKNRLKDNGASGDRKSSNNLSPPTSQNNQIEVMAYYSPLTPSKHENYPNVPPLNFVKSSDDSCENTLKNVQDLDSGHSSYPKKPAEDRQPTLSQSISPESNNMSIGSYVCEPGRSKSHHISSRPNSCDSKKDHLGKVTFRKSQNDEKDTKCKCGKICGCKTQPSSSKSLYSSHGNSNNYQCILCPCCRSNLISPNSSTSDTAGKANVANTDVPRELKKLEKVFERYQKCKVLQSFMKEYDDLVMKYALSKNAKLQNNSSNSIKEPSCKSGKDSELTSSNSSSECDSDPCVDKPNPCKNLPRSINLHSKKYVHSCQCNKHINSQMKEAKSGCLCKTKRNPKHNKEILVLKPTKQVTETNRSSESKSPISKKHFTLDKPLLVDAVTSPFLTPRSKSLNDKIETLLCEKEKFPSLSQPTSEKDSSSKSADTDRASKSSQISDELLRKVRKAFSKEYENIIKKYEAIKNTPCNTCKEGKSQASKSSNKNVPKINLVNVGKSDPSTESSDHLKSKEEKKSSKARTAETISVCPICKVLPLPMGSRLCTTCAKIQRQIHRTNEMPQKPKKVPKPIAYNLILESTENMIDESLKCQNVSLEEIIVKVPTSKRGKKNGQEALRVVESAVEDPCEEKGSTDEQIQEFSSLNSDCSEDSAASCPSSSSECSGKENEVPLQHKKYNLTVEEFLQRRRPDFICSASQRQNSLKKIREMRKKRDADLRKLFIQSVSCLPNIKSISLSDIECVAQKHGLQIPKNGYRMFNANEMVKNTARQYKKLPEIMNKKINLKKEQLKKTNILMAEIFAKKLKERTLRGCVNVSHGVNVISL